MLNIHGDILDLLNESEYYLFSILLNYGTKSCPDNSVLLHRTGWGLNKLQTAKKSLISKGLLKVEARFNPTKGAKGRESNVYVITTDLASKYNDKLIRNKLVNNKVVKNKLVKNKLVDNRVYKELLKPLIIETKVIIEKKEKDNAPFFEVFEHFVKVTGKQLRINKNNLKASDKYKKITSRLDAGFTVEDCKKVIDYKNNEWKNDKKMCQYIEISTFFAIANFEKYLDAANNTQSDLYQPTKKQFTYELPTFKNDNERFTFFLARYQLYKPYLDNRMCNTTYRDRIFLQKDVEGLVFELELERPELLEIEKPYQNG